MAVISSYSKVTVKNDINYKANTDGDIIAVIQCKNEQPMIIFKGGITHSVLDSIRKGVTLGFLYEDLELSVQQSPQD